MLSKILAGGFVLIMIGAIIAGAIAVFSPTENTHAIAQAGQHNTGLGQGLGQGQGQGLGQGQGQRQGQGQDQEQGQGQGQGQSQGQNLSQGQGQGQGRGREDTQTTLQELETITGLVVETDELVIETASGENIQIGLGPNGYREAQGFVLQTDDQVSVSGYWEDGEFKATLLENQTTGQNIVLREDTGRPMWAGQGRGKNRSL